MMTYKGVPVWEEIDGVKIIGAYTLEEFLFSGPEWEGKTWEEKSPVFRAWCSENNVAYFSAEKEDFFYHYEAVKARKEGKEILVVECLS